jgi:coniferyl-aldehyde dehydrogenase
VEALLAALVEAAAALVPPGAPLTAARRWQRPEVGGDTRIVELADGRLEVAVDPPPDAQVQTTEIFGPLLVLSRSADLDAALAWIRARPAPLAIYVFGADAAGAARLERETTSGALVFEDTVVQAACERLPFGGVGGSGFGRYHGEAGFLTFSNLRTVMRARRPRLADLLMRPWSERKLRLARRLLRGPA